MRLLKLVFTIFKTSILMLLITSFIASIGVFVWGYYFITRDLPALNRIEDYKPNLVTQVFDRNGVLIAEFFEEKRYPLKISEVPDLVIKAFLASEDASFYEHSGVDLISILRALYVNLKEQGKYQGASTITQQVVKRLLLSPKKNYIRKAKEAILAYRLEKKLTKNEILEIYLNEMYFGNGAYGLKAASRGYFHKEVGDLTIAEAAMLAGLLKAPSRYSPLKNPNLAKMRQRYVLRRMLEEGWITQEQFNMASSKELVYYKNDMTRIKRAPYFTSEVRKELIRLLGSKKKLNTGGYTVYTYLDLKAQEMAEQAIKKGLKEIDKRRGWRGPKGFIPFNERMNFVKNLSEKNKNTPDHVIRDALVLAVYPTQNLLRVTDGISVGYLNLNEARWAKRFIIESGIDAETKEIDPIRAVSVGSVIEVHVSRGKEGISFVLDQSPSLEGALVAINPREGSVISLVGGYDYSRSVFNRAIQAKRQPGSAFKPILYLTAIDAFGYTPATIVRDEPKFFKVGDEVWSPRNFDDTFLGPITLRTALERSRNLASADIISRIGSESVINYARKLGIHGLLGEHLSLALGSGEVSLFELTRAYSVFPNRGLLTDVSLISEIFDRNGSILFTHSRNIHRVISEQVAFIMAYLMKGVVENGTGRAVKALGRPVAGKTGTSNNFMDAWFIGYTPDWLCGVWVGFDKKKRIGEYETGGRAAAPIWLYFMRDFLTYRDANLKQRLQFENDALSRYKIDELPIGDHIPSPDFLPPTGVNKVWIDKKTGLLSCDECDGAIPEYFISGTEPTKSVEDISRGIEEYLLNPNL